MKWSKNFSIHIIFINAFRCIYDETLRTTKQKNSYLPLKSPAHVITFWKVDFEGVDLLSGVPCAPPSEVCDELVDAFEDM